MKYENGTFEANVSELRALTTYASTDQTRPHLAAVCFDMARARVAATDGHRMIVIDAWTGKPGAGAVLVKAKELQSALRGLGAKGKKVRVQCELGSVTIEADAVRAMLPTVNASFPPIDQVMPERGSNHPAQSVGFNPAYVRDIGVIGDIQETYKQRPSCALQLGAELDPARIDADLLEGGHLTIVVMPMRI